MHNVVGNYHETSTIVMHLLYIIHDMQSDYFDFYCRILLTLGLHYGTCAWISHE